MKKIWNWLFGAKSAENPQGISEFKSLIKTGLNIAVKIKEIKADGKISTVEWIGLGKVAVPLVSNIRNWKLLKDQALDFTSEEGIELAAYAVELGILPTDAKTVVAHVIAAIEKGYAIYTNDVVPIINVFKK